MKDYLLNMVPEKIDYIYAKLFDNNHIGSKFGLVRGETLCTMDFIDKLLIEIQKIDVSLIGLSLSQLRIKVSEIIKGSKNFLKHILDRIRNPNHPDYNLQYSFSRELLDLFIQNLKKKYGEEITNCIDLVQKYKDSNFELKTCSGKQYHLHNPNLEGHFFEKIDSKDKAYWLGFLLSDRSITLGNIKRTRYQISIEVSIKDKDQLVKFCTTLGLNIDKVKERDRIITYNGGEKRFRIAYVQFACRTMVDDLKQIGFFEF